ncbi:hypothetical protein [Streptomyces sp. NPDC058326]
MGEQRTYPWTRYEGGATTALPPAPSYWGSAHSDPLGELRPALF